MPRKRYLLSCSCIAATAELEARVSFVDTDPAAQVHMGTSNRMTKARVKLDEKGLWQLSLGRRKTTYVELEEAVETARDALRSSGGGTIEVVDRGHVRYRIKVPALGAGTSVSTPARDAPASTPASSRAATAPENQPEDLPASMAQSAAKRIGKGLNKSIGDVVQKQADRAIEAGLAGWWSRADEGQKIAVWALVAAAVVGPLGQGLLGLFGVLYEGPSLPSGKQVEAVAVLFLITLPVAAWVLAVVLLLGKMSGPGVLIAAGVVSYFGGVAMAGAGVPKDLGDFYCFADLSDQGISYESACRQFDTLGFVSNTYDKVGSPSGSPEIFQWAVIYTADARGMVMVLASIVASVALGYLIRRAQ